MNLLKTMAAMTIFGIAWIKNPMDAIPESPSVSLNMVKEINPLMNHKKREERLEKLRTLRYSIVCKSRELEEKLARCELTDGQIQDYLKLLG